MKNIEQLILNKIKELNNFSIENYNEDYFFSVLKLFYLNQKYLNNNNLKINIFLEELLNTIFNHPSILIKENENIDKTIKSIMSKRILQEN